MLWKRDFKAKEFTKLPQSEQIAVCFYEAERAEKISEHADPIHRELYLGIARDWTHVANELERDLRRRF
jgi:hypothetical protein